MLKENGFRDRFFNKEIFAYDTFRHKYLPAAVQYVFATQNQYSNGYQKKRRVYMLKAKYRAQYYFKYPEIKTIDEFVELLLKQDEVALKNDFNTTRPINIDDN